MVYRARNPDGLGFGVGNHKFFTTRAVADGSRLIRPQMRGHGRGACVCLRHLRALPAGRPAQERKEVGHEISRR
jgi:hypothetical protein